jgi:hypothetical protein
MDEVRWERRREHRGGGGNMLDKVTAMGAHSNGGSMVSCDGSGSMAMSEAMEALQWSPTVV